LQTHSGKKLTCPSV